MRRLAPFAVAILLTCVLVSAGCAAGERVPQPLGYTVSGRWELHAEELGDPEGKTVVLVAELEDLGDGRVEVRGSWRGIPVSAVAHLEGTSTLEVPIDTPRVAKGLVVAEFEGERVNGTAEGSYVSGRRRGTGKATFEGDRISLDVGKTGVPGLDAAAESLQSAIGGVFPRPDFFRGSVGADLAVLGTLALMLVARVARSGRKGRAVRADGPYLDTRVLRGAKAASHLAHHEYISVTEDGLCESTEKLEGFDPAQPAGEDGVRGVSYRTITDDRGRVLVVVSDLMAIVQMP